MRARIVKSILDTGSAARDYIRLVCGRKQPSVRPVDEDETREGATELLEVFRNHRRKRESDYILTGRRVIEAMDEHMTDFSVPFEFTATARSLGKGIVEGSFVTIPGDDRVFRVLKVWYEHESARIADPEDLNGIQYVVPWRILTLVRQKGDSR
jgi:hypothetical protein